MLVVIFKRRRHLCLFKQKAEKVLKHNPTYKTCHDKNRLILTSQLEHQKQFGRSERKEGTANC